MPRPPPPARIIIASLFAALVAFLLVQAVGLRSSVRGALTGPPGGTVSIDLPGASWDENAWVPPSDVCMWDTGCIGEESCTVSFNRLKCVEVPDGCDPDTRVSVWCGDRGDVWNTRTTGEPGEVIELPAGGACACGENATCLFRLQAPDGGSPSCAVSCPPGQVIIHEASGYGVDCPWSSPSTSSASSSTSSSFSSPSSSSSTSSSSSPGKAQLQVAITDNRTTEAPGKTLTYWVTVQNVSAVDAYTSLTVSLSDVSLVSLVSAPGALYDAQLGTVQWPAFFVPAWTSVPWSFTLTLQPTAPHMAPLTALAQVTGDYSQDTTIIVQPVPDTGCIVVTKKAFGADGITPLPPADIPDFSFSATPAAGGTPVPAYRLDANHWTIPNLPLGSYHVLEQMPVGAGWTQTVPAGGQSATVAVAKGPPCATIDFQNRRNAVAATFSVTTTAQPPAIPRDGTTTVSVKVMNTSAQSPTADTPVSLSLEWPFVASGTPSDGGVVQAQGGLVTWSVPSLSLSPGQSKTVSVPVRISPNAQTVLPSAQFTATATAPGATSSVSIFVLLPEQSCVLVRKEAVSWQGTPLTGGLQQYQFSFVLDGSEEQVGDDAGYVLFDVAPGVHTLAERAVVGWDPTGVKGLDPVNASFLVGNGECPMVTFQNTQKPPPLALALAHVPAAAGMADPQTVLPGGAIHYTITLQNTTPENRPATGVAVSLTLPSPLQYVGGAQQSGGTSVGATIQWNGLMLPPGTTTLWFDAKTSPTVAPGTPIATTVTLTAPDVPGKVVSLSHSASITVVPSPAQKGCLDVVKQVLLPPGGEVPGVFPPFPFRMTAPGGAVQPATVAVSLPSTAGASATAPPYAEGTTTIPNLAPGMYTVQEQPLIGYDVIGPAVKTVTIVPGPCATVVFQNQPVPGEPSFSMANTDDTETAEPGRILTYTITVTNISSVDAPGAVTVIDTLPQELLFVPLPSTPGEPVGKYDPVNRRMTWIIPGLAPGAAASLRIAGQVHPSTADGTVINNTAGALYLGQPAGPATDTTLVEKPSAETGCIRIVKHSFTPWGVEVAWEPPFTFRLDGNEKFATTNTYGIGLFQNIPVGVHSLAEILLLSVVEGPSETYEWKEVSMSPGPLVTVQKNACTEVTVVNRQTPVPEKTCGDGVCALWLYPGETCAICPADCGTCEPPPPKSSSSASSTSFSSSSSSLYSSAFPSSASSASSASFSTSSSTSSSSDRSDQPNLSCDRRLTAGPVTCKIHDAGDDPRIMTVFFVKPFMSLNALDAAGNPVGPVGDIATGMPCEDTCGKIRTVGLCCRKHVPGQPDCPVLPVGECEATGQGVTIPFSEHSDTCKLYMDVGACG